MGRSGTGLGLTLVWNVTHDHKGYVDVKSDTGGTTFDLYFPLTREKVLEKESSASIEELSGNGELVLVVDDVEGQREIACGMLKKLGYQTKAVPSGEAALEYLKSHTADLVLLDMIMDPGINGRKTYERIIEIHPHQKAVIASGYAETDDVKETIKMGAGRFLKKPLTLFGLGVALKEELNRKKE